MKIQHLFVIILSLFIINVYSYGESDIDGNPNYYERVSHVLVNAVRLDPKGYLNKYFGNLGYKTFGILGSRYGKTHPVYVANNLGRVAKLHSQDMAVNNCFKHTDCNGTDTFVRIKKFYSCPGSGSMSENIGAGYSSPVDINNGLICETDKSNCYPDGTNDGHRANIMSPSYNTIGIGLFYRPSDNTPYWTQDFASSTCDPSINIKQQPIHSGSHFFKKNEQPPKVTYMATFYSPNETAQIIGRIVFENGNVSFLQLDLGSKNAGAYIYEPETFQECTQYYFEFKANETIYRYPNTGSLSSSSTQLKSNCPNTWSSKQFSPNAEAPDWDDYNDINSSTIISPNYLLLLLFICIFVFFN
eukprot:gene2561-3171_t